jgi:hypothetical protein
MPLCFEKCVFIRSIGAIVQMMRFATVETGHGGTQDVRVDLVPGFRFDGFHPKLVAAAFFEDMFGAVGWPLDCGQVVFVTCLSGTNGVE